MPKKSNAPDAVLGEPQHAVVFSGGGANAAYEVGVIKALIREPTKGGGGRPIIPEIYTGTSIGALNAAVLVSEADSSINAAVEKLERLWLDRIASSRANNGLFRFRFNPVYYLDPRTWLPNPIEPFTNMTRDSLRLLADAVKRTAHALGGRESFEERALRLIDLSTGVDMSPLEKLIRDEIDVSKISLSAKQLRVIAANWEEGKPETFDNGDIEDERGYQAILAAAAIPGVVPSQVVDNALYVDGAVLSDAPLLPAIQAHGRNRDRDLVIHVVYQDPEAANVRPSQVPNTFSTVYRLYVLAFARSVSADMEAAARINERLQTIQLNREVLEELKKTEAAGESQARQDLEDMLEEMSRDVADKVGITVHRYRPSEPTTGFLGLLDFNRDRIQRLIERGYHDARKHDCEESDCVRIKPRKA